MSAIRLRDLRQAIASLLARPAQASERAAALAALLARHGNRAYRPGAQANADEPAYHTARVVLVEVWRGLRHALPTTDEERLALADALWARAYREPRLLAARVLGEVRPTAWQAVWQRFWPWLAVRDRRVQAAVLEHAARPLTLAGDIWLQHLQPFLPPAASLPEAQRALLAVSRLIRSRAFDNTPLLFRVLRPGLLHPTAEVRGDWIPVLHALLARWPAETVPFLRRTLWETRDPATLRWLLRRVTPHTAEPWRSRLQALQREQSAPAVP